MKYLRYFETEADRTKASDNGEFVKPHVSYTNETKRVDFIGKNSVSITMKSTADTTVDVFYTVDDFKALKGNETITLKANEAKTTLINRPYIFSPGVVKYDYSTGKGASANTAVTEITIDGTVENGEYLLSRTHLVSSDLSSMDTSKMTNMSQLFGTCPLLTTAKISNFDTSNVRSMFAMFDACYKLTSIDISSFDTGKVTDMSWMFNGCQVLASLDVSRFDTSNVIRMNNMFAGCLVLTSLNVSNFNTSNVVSMESMFRSCRSLKSLDLSSFDTGKVTNMSKMFNECTGLTSLNLGTFDTRKVTSRTDMFKDINPKVEITLAADSPSLTNIQTQLVTDGVTGAKIHFNGKTYYYDTTTTSWKGITSGK